MGLACAQLRALTVHGGSINGSEVLLIVQHVRECKNCEAFFDALRSFDSAVALLSADGLSRDVLKARVIDNAMSGAPVRRW